MIISITTSTVTALSTGSFAQVLAVLSGTIILAWIGMMCTRVLAASINSNKAQRIAVFLNVGIVPLTIVCSVIFLAKIISILS